MYTSRYFAPAEFQHCVPSCTIEQMDEEFLEKLDELRYRCGFSLVLNCAYRSKEWDLSKGRSGKSMHCLGRAVDIRCKNALERAKIVMFALELGFRVGVASTFVHVDYLPQLGSLPAVPVLWNYKK